MAGYGSPAKSATGPAMSPVRTMKRVASEPLPGIAKPKVTRDRNPGPGAYKSIGSVGRQWESRRPTQPIRSFGTAPARESLTKAGDTPGPGTYKAMNFGETVVSTKLKSPVYSMRGREKFGAVDEVSRTVNNPAPGAYGRPKIPGKAAPAYSLLGKRNEKKRRSSTPGPGRYKGPSSFGPQVESTIRSHAGAAFAASKRPPLTVSKSVIGPGEYAYTPGTGKQTSSKRRNVPAFSFGTSSRFARDAQQSRSLRAGPGSYKLPGAIGRQVASTLRSMPAASMASRHNFGSPYPDL